MHVVPAASRWATTACTPAGRYAPDWVLIGEPQTDDRQSLLGGKVLFHSPDREEVYQKAVELRPGDFAFRFLGEMPADMVFLF